MTTPERLRRRQRIEGAFLVVIGLLLIASTLWFRHQDESQRACIGDNFTEMASALNARGELAERDAQLGRREARAQKAESRANRIFYREAFAAESREGVFEAYGDYRVRIAAVDVTRAEIKVERQAIRAERESNPFPDFPAGTCD